MYKNLLIANILVITSLLLCLPQSANAELKCLKVTTSKGKLVSKITTSRTRCKKGTVKLFDTNSLIGNQGVQGAQGAAGSNGTNGTNGANGADGAVNVWGDASAGDLIINESGVLQATNLQYQNVTINPGNTVNIVSGTTIKATGTCTIAGSISVLTGSNGGSSNDYESTTLTPSRRLANHGLAFGAPGVGEFGSNGNQLRGGFGGKKLSSEQAGTLVKLRRTSFGSGGESGGGSFSGGAGGGGFALYCRGGIVISGTISANGANGSTGGGGGSGGLIVIASETSITSSGIISANGGNGGSSSSGYGRGGGGGGGIIHFLAPSIIEPGGTDVTGGSAGSLNLQVTNNPRMSGSGGGALGGDGGDGGTVETNNVPGAATAGTSGYFFETTANPTSLIL